MSRSDLQASRPCRSEPPFQHCLCRFRKAVWRVSLFCLANAIRFYLDLPFGTGAVRRQSVLCDRTIQVSDGRFGRRQHPTLEVAHQGIMRIGHPVSHGRTSIQRGPLAASSSEPGRRAPPHRAFSPDSECLGRIPCTPRRSDSGTSATSSKEYRDDCGAGQRFGSGYGE